MKLDVLSRICGFNITFKRGLLNVSMPLQKCFRGVIQLLRIAEGESQRTLCICVDKQHPLVLPGKPDAEVGGGRGLAHAALLVRHRDHFAIRHMGFLLRINLAACGAADGYVIGQISNFQLKINCGKSSDFRLFLKQPVEKCKSACLQAAETYLTEILT